jgi:hypothetical protein
LIAVEMNSPVNTQLVERIRRLIEAAQEKSEPRPGRPTLVKTTGAKAHEVRKALFVLSLIEDLGGDAIRLRLMIRISSLAPARR